ncbi:hypothetical protein [Stakelama marina]|uniref:Uncharacterized protein n=1 Tax=Stakelama marina TaxID=2826939 RepID=A0A8T4I8N0_9SPHN|nr:hypothetical protein [Stakelama marina]MBR0551017.1 hypothetical protein [Stakelama marina]
MTPSDPPGNRPVDSLFDRMMRIRFRRRSFAWNAGQAAGRAFPDIGPRRSWVVPALVALLIASGPALTWAAASILHARIRAQIEALREKEAPALAARAARQRGRDMLSDAFAVPPAANVLDRIAKVLLEQVRLSDLRRSRDGALEMQIAASDPDQLREALRRDPLFARLRDTGQRRGDGVMIVTLREGAR